MLDMPSTSCIRWPRASVPPSNSTRPSKADRAGGRRARDKHPGAHLTALQRTPIIGATFAPEPCVRRSRP
jgi:hypothetical protein